MKHIISLLLLPATCVREDEMAQKGDIRLAASLIPSGIMTRGEGVLDPHYGEELTIGMARIDERVTPDYPLFDNTAGQLKAVMKSGRSDTNSRDISFVDSFQQFLNVNSNIKFASWYPFGDNSYDARRKSVSTPIEGTTDILYGSVAYYLVWTNSSSDDGSLVYTYKDSGNVRNPGVKEIPRYGIYLTRNTFDRTWYPYTGYIDSYDGTKDIMVSDVREAQYWPPPSRRATTPATPTTESRSTASPSVSMSRIPPTTTSSVRREPMAGLHGLWLLPSERESMQALGPRVRSSTSSTPSGVVM